IRLLLADQNSKWVFAVDPWERRYCTQNGAEDKQTKWQSFILRGGPFGAVALIAIPRGLFRDLNSLRVDVIHRRKEKGGFVDYELCPTYSLGSNPDLIPDWKPTLGEGNARLQVTED